MDDDDDGGGGSCGNGMAAIAIAESWRWVKEMNGFGWCSRGHVTTQKVPISSFIQ
jgi:hypothetical protein